MMTFRMSPVSESVRFEKQNLMVGHSLDAVVYFAHTPYETSHAVSQVCRLM